MFETGGTKDAMRRSSAAQVLHNDYILREIFETHRLYLSNDVPAVQRLQLDDLARCARVCRSFSDPALGVLWRELVSILPLWHLLSPADLPYPRKREEVEKYCAAVLGAETYRDAVRRERFRSYTSFIHVLAQSGPIGKDIPLLFSVLRTEFPGTTMFPSLRQLRWIPSDGKGSLFDFAVLFSPALTSLDLYLSWFSEQADFDDAKLETLRNAGAQSPGLKTLTIRSNGWWTPGEDTVLSSFRCLRKIELICAVDPSVLHQLVQIPTLRSISLRISSMPRRNIQLPRSYDAPHLEKLTLIGTTLHLTQVLSPMRATALICLGLTLMDFDAGACMQAAANAVPRGSLQSFAVTLNSREPWPPTLDFTSLLRPVLIQHPGISLFRLRAGVHDTLPTEDDLARIAGGWGNLEAFAITGEWELATPAPSANVLYHFWKSCPRLRQLSLPYLELDVDIEPHDDYTPTKPSSHGLSSLIIDPAAQPPSALTSDRTRAWALYLHRLFPHLESPSELHTALNPTWKEVFQEMCSLAAHDGRGDS